MLLRGQSIDFKIIEKLCQFVSFEKDLPDYVFSSKHRGIRFFERPILAYEEMLLEILSSNKRHYDSSVFISFGIPKSDEHAIFLIDYEKLELSLSVLRSGFNTFFEGTVRYPLLISNMNINWVAFESAYEELGVLVVEKEDQQANEFINELTLSSRLAELPIFDCEQFKSDSSSYQDFCGVYGDLVKILGKNYCF
ncbi:hypothetical protein [Methylomonas methanica]|uniref:Uncharacterized protein n=1 Tax=Methylomonas methanica (strain DSM 25384 / MC09) TaxID=857087 RepID=G0A3Y6_METMM|nr:hypothetical protein [Methylomonas methanica]AEG02758.1 hypothetical protein Metme_4412 [Methylomonas methanica MC09]